MFNNYTQSCLNIIKSTGEKLKEGFYENFEINSKSRLNDLITEYDLISEKLIVDYIKLNFPEHNILTEEEGIANLNENSEFTWIIDPIDGTVNFANKLPIFSISIALKHKNEIVTGAVFNPISNELFYAEKGKGAFLNSSKIEVSKCMNINESFLVTGFPYNVTENPLNCLETFVKIIQKGIPVRRLGSAALDLCFVAAGRFDGFWEVFLKPWDMAAGKLILEEAGGIVTYYNGEEHQLDENTILASNGLIHNDLMRLVNEN